MTVTDEVGRPAGPWAIERAVRAVRPDIVGLPSEFRFQDLRHYLASLLIADGLEVKVVQARLRHASAKTTLDVYSHLTPRSVSTADLGQVSRTDACAVLLKNNWRPRNPGPPA